MTSRVTGESFTEGDWISINGTTGEVVKGRLELVPPQVSPLFTEFLGWARSLAPIRVHANADSPADVIQALTFGAQGIGLCRSVAPVYSRWEVEPIARSFHASTNTSP